MFQTSGMGVNTGHKLSSTGEGGIDSCEPWF